MHKLQHAFSMPVPDNSKSRPSFKLNQRQMEHQYKERISRLKSDLNETPNSKYKYKQIAREIKD